MRSIVSAAVCVAICALGGTGSAYAVDKKGTMHLLPQGSWAKSVPEKALGKLRGGYRGLAFSAVFMAFVENRNGNLSGSGDTGGSTPPVTTTPQGDVSVSTNVSFSGNLSGIFNIVQVPGNYNVVNSTLNVNIALVNVASGGRLPSLSSLFK